MRRFNDSKTRILSIIRSVGKVNRITNRYEFSIEEVTSHSSAKYYTHEKLMSVIDSLIRSYVIKLIDSNKYSCDAKALEKLDEA